MAEYISNVVEQTSKLDWAFPFQRTGQFPLDRSALFSSYEDAVKYASGEATDERELGGTSYVGQIISVYTAPSGDATEDAPGKVTVYVINDARELQELSYALVGDNKGVEIVNGTIQIKGLSEASSGEQIRVNGNGELEFFTPSTDTVDGLQSAVGALQGQMSTAEGKISALETKVGNDTVANQIDAKITALKAENLWDTTGSADAALADAKTYADSLASNYDAKGSAAQALTDAKSYADGLASNYDAKGSAAQALTDAKAYTDEKDTAMDARVDALEAKFGDGEGSVADQIADAVAAEASAREQAVAGVQGEVDALEALHATDKTELEGKITTAQNKADAAQTHSEGVATNLATEVAARETLAGRVAAIEADYLVEADKTELANSIKSVDDVLKAVKEDVDTFFADADMTTNAKDTLKELQEYITSDTTGAAAMAESIQQNKTAIESNDADILALQGDMTSAKGTIQEHTTTIGQHAETIATKAAQADLTALEARVTTAEGAVATKAEKTALDALTTRVSTNETAIGTKAAQTDLEALEARVDTAEPKITALETKVGSKAVATQISEAIAAENLGQYAKAADLSTTNGKVATLESEMDAVEGRATALEADVSALETEVAKKANDADLHKVAKSGLISDLDQTENTYIVFDCGSASTNI